MMWRAANQVDLAAFAMTRRTAGSVMHGAMPQVAWDSMLGVAWRMMREQAIIVAADAPAARVRRASRSRGVRRFRGVSWQNG
jgi:hypothetical protein